MSEQPASCRVADLLAARGLGLTLATPEADITVPVRWVQTTELVNPTPYLRSDELVCTVGTSLVTAEAIRTFVDAVAGRAAAVCFGIGDVHERAPAALVGACRRAGLPLLTLPFGVAFLDVADVVERLRGQASQARALGHLLDLVAADLARPESIGEALSTHDLDPRALVVAAWPSGSAAVLAAQLPGAALAEATGHAVTLSRDPASVVAAAAATGLPCGYADSSPLPELADALATARVAFTAAAGGHARGQAEMATFAQLIESVPRENLRPFVARLVRPLIEAGGAASPTYLDTLRAFLDHDLSVGRAAKAQFLHPNTVRHRLALIKELTGKDPFILDDLLALAVAVRAFDRSQHR